MAGGMHARLSRWAETREADRRYPFFARHALAFAFQKANPASTESQSGFTNMALACDASGSGAPVPLRLDGLPVEILTQILRDSLERDDEGDVQNAMSIRTVCSRLRLIALPLVAERLSLYDWASFESFVEYVDLYPHVAAWVKELRLRFDFPNGQLDYHGHTALLSESLDVPMSLHLYSNIRVLELENLTDDFFLEHVQSRSLPAFSFPALEHVSLKALKGDQESYQMGYPLERLHQFVPTSLRPFWIAPRLKAVSLGGFILTANQNDLSYPPGLPQLDSLTFIDCSFHKGVASQLGRSRATKKLWVQRIDSDITELVSAFAPQLEDLTLLNCEVGPKNQPPERFLLARFRNLKVLNMYMEEPFGSQVRPPDLGDDALFIARPLKRHVESGFCPLFFPASLEQLYLSRSGWDTLAISTFNRMIVAHQQAFGRLKVFTMARYPTQKPSSFLDSFTFLRLLPRYDGQLQSTHASFMNAGIQWLISQHFHPHRFPPEFECPVLEQARLARRNEQPRWLAGGVGGDLQEALSRRLQITEAVGVASSSST